MSGNDDDEKGPLAFLDRLLEEERDSNLHLGDVRFWKHIEYIQTAHIYRTSSLEYRTMKVMVFEAIFYLLFLATLSSLIINQRAGALYESRNVQLQYWAGCQAQRTGGVHCSINDITSQDQLMTWFKETLVEKAFAEADSYEPITPAVSIFRLQSGVMAWKPRYVGDTKTSILMGSIRIRQLRVQYNLDCTIMDDLIDIHPDCFPKYSPGVESKMKWHPVWTPEQVQPHYKWYAPNETNQGDTSGYHGTYPGSGFILDLPMDRASAVLRLQELEEWSWLDVRTRAVIVELTTLNPNVNIFVNTKLLFEFPATGGVYMKQDVTSFKALQMNMALAATDDLAGTFSMLVFTTGLALLFFCYVTYLIFKNGARYFTYFWSVVDVIILVLYFIQICTYLVIFGTAEREPNMNPEVLADPEMFFPSGKLVPHLEFSNACLACLSLFAWLKVLKYFTLSSTFMGYVRVIERCIVNLLMFTSLLFLVLFGFAVALHIGYGKDDNLFATIWGSLVAVIVAPAGGVDLSPIVGPGDILGPVLIFVYIIVVFLLLLNVLMAICVDTYSVCMFQLSEVQEGPEGKKLNPTVVFLYTYFNAMFKVKLVGKESLEDRGSAQEQEIPLTSLPEAVQLQYLAERQRMQLMFDNAEAQIKEEERKRREPELYATTMSGDDDDADPLPPPTMQGFAPQPPEEDMQDVIVKRVQLQRMLEDNEVLVEVCGTQRAVDLIRRFRVDLTGVDPYEAVAQLQANVANKLKELESHGGTELTFDEMEALKCVSSELHTSLTESQKEWRAELLSVLQMATLLSKALIDLTGQLAKVQVNHTELETKTAPK